MLGEREDQLDFFRADHCHLDHVGRETFYGWLATEGREHFRDEDFVDCYTLDNGRRSIPPSQMLMLLLLQGYDRISDREAVQRTRFDLRYKVALGLHDHDGLCAYQSLSVFRARLLLHDMGREILMRSVQACRKAGVLKRRKIKSSIDTTPIYGRGAVKDTYNLVADGIVAVLHAVTAQQALRDDSVSLEAVAASADLSRYVTCSSIKGDAELDWNDEAARDAFLTELVTDARRALRFADGIRVHDGDIGGAIAAGCALLERLLVQDVQLDDAGNASLIRGTAKDRVVSVHDPEMRHGHKSKRNRFEGHKGELVVDNETGTILDATVKPGNAGDADGSLAAVERAEATLREVFADDDETAAAPAEIAETLGDCAYGTANNRREFEDAGRTLSAKQAVLHNGGRFTKEAFPEDEATGERTCPAGHRVAPVARRVHWRGKQVRVRQYAWPREQCLNCPLRAQCLKPRKDKQPHRHGRTVSEHPEEALLTRARRQQQSREFRDGYRKRQTVEHRLARMTQLGARQARYFGKAKTELQWLLTAAVANLTLAASAISRIFALWPTLAALSGALVLALHSGSHPQRQSPHRSPAWPTRRDCLPASAHRGFWAGF